MMRNLAVQRRIPIECILLCLCAALASSAKGDGGSNAVKIRAAKSGKPVSSKTIESLLKSKSEPHWEKGLASVTSESLNDDKLVEALSQFASRESTAEHFTPSLVRAIAFLADAKQPIAYDQLHSLLKANDYRVVMAAADLVSIGQDRGFLEPLMSLSHRREFADRYGFRRCVVDAVGRYHDKTAVDFLMDRLEKSDGQLKYEVAVPDPSAIVIAISNHNLTQRTTIHTLGIDARDNHEQFLKNLAEKNSGKLLVVR